MIPGRDAHFVVVPPPQMPVNLKAGHLDGYCVGEPWNAVAVKEGFGWRVASSVDIAPQHPEKVLMVRREFAKSRAGEHEALIAALLAACRFCAQPQNRERIIETLGELQYVNAPASALGGSFDGESLAADATGPAAINVAHEPSADKAAWVLDHLEASGLLPGPVRSRATVAAKIFRADIFQKAIDLKPRYETKDSISCSSN
jgi:ABC-type nitrate/sulfonate/bicarbonate transport system substrate-binding protein